MRTGFTVSFFLFLLVFRKPYKNQSHFLPLRLQKAPGKADAGCHGQRAVEGMGFSAPISPRRVSHLHLFQRRSSDRSQPSPDKQKSEMKQPVLDGSQRSGVSLLCSPTQLLITKVSLAPSSCLVFILAWISPGRAHGEQAVQPSQIRTEDR